MAKRERQERGRRNNGEGSISFRKDGRWKVDITIEDYTRRSYYFKTEKEAVEGRRKLLNELAQGRLATGPQRTVKDYLEDWLENVQKDRLHISSYVKYKKLINSYIVPAFGDIPLQKLTPQRVQKLYADKLKQKLSPKMVSCIHGVLHVALENAVKWNLIARNVCDVVSLPRVPKTEKQVLTKRQAHVLLEHVKKHRLEAILVLAVTTGLRRGEMLALRWRDVDFEDGSVQVRRTVDYIPHYGYVENEAKTARGQCKVMLPSFVMNTLQVHRLQQQETRNKVGSDWVEKDLIFCGLQGDYFNPNYLLRMFKKVLVEAGLPHMRIHDLRHSAATILLSMGVHPKVVQEILGHSTISMTMDTYSHVLPSMQQEATDGWDKEFNSFL